MSQEALLKINRVIPMEISVPDRLVLPSLSDSLPIMGWEGGIIRILFVHKII